MNKPGLPKGTRLPPRTDEHKEKIRAGLRKFQQTALAAEQNEATSRRFSGQRPSVNAVAGSQASRHLMRIGLSRAEVPELWEHYRRFYKKMEIGRRDNNGAKRASASK